MFKFYKHHTRFGNFEQYRKSWSASTVIKNPVRLCRFSSFPKIDPI